jgi:putative endonuclease
MAFVYILKSSKDGRCYYGCTKNLVQRLKAHNAGKVRSTKSRRPLVLHYSEEYDNMYAARKGEIYFKRIDGYNWLKKERII